MAGVTTLLNFILQLLADPELAESYVANPEETLADNGLSGVTAAEVTHTVGTVSTLVNAGAAPAAAFAIPVAAAAPADILNSFVTNYYADSINNVWADGDVTQAFAAPGGIAIAGGEEVEDVNIATDGGLVIGGDVEHSGVANGGGIAAHGDVEFENVGEVVVGDDNVTGDNNQVAGEDIVNVSNASDVIVSDGDVNHAEGGSQIAGGDLIHAEGGSQIAGGDVIQNSQLAGGDVIQNSQIAGDDLAFGTGSIATDGNVANGQDAIATDGNVGTGGSEVAGDNANIVSDDDVNTQTVTQTASYVGPVARRAARPRAPLAVKVDSVVPAVPAVPVVGRFRRNRRPRLRWLGRFRWLRRRWRFRRCRWRLDHYRWLRVRQPALDDHVRQRHVRHRGRGHQRGRHGCGREQPGRRSGQHQRGGRNRRGCGRRPVGRRRRQRCWLLGR